MKLVVADRPIERLNVNPEKSFTVKNTGKAFKILSSGLYKDKIRAIIRELSCNAYDAHIMVGKVDVPFEVHLPNSYEPFFSIRDFGPGLSDEDIYHVYTTYFESTKSNSNDFIGALGLGSKSPFSYIDCYTAISVFNGERREYLLFMNEDGCPVVTQSGETEKTDDPSGMLITIPVDTKHDFITFERAASSVFEFFPTQPIVRNSPNFKFNKIEYLLEGTNFKARKLNYDNYMSGSRAIMGVIGYPIGTHSIDEDNIFSLPLDITVNIGDLDITAGREELSYDKKITLPKLKEINRQIKQELNLLINKKISSCATEFEARKLWGELNAAGIIDDNIHVVWKNIVIDSNILTYNIDPMGNYVRFSMFDKVKYTVGVTHFGRNYSKSRYRVDTDRQFSTTATKDYTFVINDETHGSLARCRKYYDEHKGVVVLVTTEKDIDLENIKKKFDGCTFINVSSIPKTERKKIEFRQPRSKLTATRIPSYVLSNNINDMKDKGSTTFDKDEGGFYILYRHGKAENIPYDFNKKYSMALNMGIINDDIDVYAIPLSTAKAVTEHEKWQDFKPYLYNKVTETIETWLSDPDFMKNLKLYNSFEKMDDNELNLIYALRNFLSEEFAGLDKENDIMRLLEWKNSCNDVDFSSKLKLFSMFDRELPLDINTEVSDLIKVIVTKYPMMMVLINHWKNYSRSFDEAEINVICDYIKSMN